MTRYNREKEARQVAHDAFEAILAEKPGRAQRQLDRLYALDGPSVRFVALRANLESLKNRLEERDHA